MTSLRKHLLTAAAGIALAAGYGTAALAGPTTVVDGITLPQGGTIVAQLVEETIVTGTGQQLFGIGIINSISAGINTTYTYGQGGLFLQFSFSGFTSSFIVPPTAGSSGFIEFTGGSASVKLTNFAPNLSTGNQATDFANANLGTNFLTATAVPFASSPTVVAAGGPTTTTLEAVLPNNTDLNNFTNAFGSAFFDATSGDAVNNFHTCGFALAGAGAPCPSNTVDLTFTESFNSGSSDDFPVSGTGNVKANIVAVPEPGSLSVLGMGLLALTGAVYSRKRRRA